MLTMPSVGGMRNRAAAAEPEYAGHCVHLCNARRCTGRAHLVCDIAAVVGHILQQLLQSADLVIQRHLLKLNEALQRIILKASVTEGGTWAALLLLGCSNQYLTRLCSYM